MTLNNIQIQVIQGKICPYCHNQSKLINSKEFYGTDYGMMYICHLCSVWVGCHPDTSNALGRLANKELRLLKNEAHLYFDKIWQTNRMSRTSAYKWLSEQLNIQREYTHIGMFGEETCKKVVYLSKIFLNNKK